jgi:hypothetical protein
MRDDRRLRSLAMAHVSLGLIAEISAPIEIRTPFGLPHLPIVPLFALTFSQVVLLASWAVFSPAAVWRRLDGPVVGLAFLEALFDLALSGEFVGMPFVAMTVISGSLLAMRGFGVRLRGRDDPAFYARPESWRPRFSIRAIMMLTVVVALLSTAVRALKGSNGLSFLGLRSSGPSASSPWGSWHSGRRWGRPSLRDGCRSSWPSHRCSGPASLTPPTPTVTAGSTSS